MNKKEIILDILKKLFWIWDLAQWLYNLIDSAYINNESNKLIDILIKIINNSLINIENKVIKEKLNKSMLKLKQLQEKEQIERQNDEKQLKEIEKMFE